MIFVPREIRVGYQERKDTYTGKLAYIIYYDHKGVLRKQVSWDGWRHASIEPNTFKNEPTEGFVLNKKAGGYSTGWNHRQTYTRVYDPRGFEFEITIPNLMYVLENANCIKGKGLEGEFVYGWDGTELTLVPVDAPDYKGMVDYANMMFENKAFKGKDLILGATYSTKQGDHCVYLGRFPYYENGKEFKNGKKAPNRYFFQYIGDAKNQSWWSAYNIVTSLRDRIISLVDAECAHNYADMMSALECERIYSYEDITQFTFTEMTADEVKKVSSYEEIWMKYEGMFIPINLRSYGRNHMELSRDRFFDIETITDYTRIIEKVVLEIPLKKDSYSSYHYANEVDKTALHAKYPLYKANIFLKNGKPLGGAK